MDEESELSPNYLKPPIGQEAACNLPIFPVSSLVNDTLKQNKKSNPKDDPAVGCRSDGLPFLFLFSKEQCHRSSVSKWIGWMMS